MIWNIVIAIATIISTIAYIVTALYIRAELKHAEKDRYLSVTGQLFDVWLSQEFMHSQMWLLHKLDESTWQGFVDKHRGDFGEAAFHRVGAFYDRIGTLSRMRLIDEKEILSTVGAHAIAVWQKIEPLVREARRIENSVLFDDFEQLLPSCYECYVPALGQSADVQPFSLMQRRDRISRNELKQRLDRGDPTTVLDVRSTKQGAENPRVLPGAIRMPADVVEQRYAELPADRETAVYCA